MCLLELSTAQYTAICSRQVACTHGIIAMGIFMAVVDNVLKHQIYFERYKTAEANKLLKIIDDANKTIKELVKETKSIPTKKRYTEISKQLNDIAKEARARIEETFSQNSKDFIDSEINWQIDMLKENIGIDKAFILPSGSQVYNAVVFNPYTEKLTYKTFLDGIQAGLYETWDATLRTGYLTGMTTQQIVSYVLGKAENPGSIEGLRNSVMRNTRTALQAVAYETRKAVYEKNSDIFTGYKWLATLDRRTCLSCASLDLKVFKSIKDAPSQPLHHNCRCTLLPIIEGIDVEGQRESEDGYVDEKLNYENWLKKQPVEVQKEILGLSRYKLFKETGKIGDFVLDNRILSLDELKSKK